MTRTSVLEGWQSFESACVPAGASEEARRDFYMAFFAGAGFLLRELQQVTSMSDDEAHDLVASLANELNAHVAALFRRPFVMPPRRTS